MRVFFDTSALVAASERSHPHHHSAWPLLRSVAAGKITGIRSAHSPAELYAALTRLPVQPRIRPAGAQRIITETILPHFEVVPLTRADYAAIVQDMGRQEIPWARLDDAL